MDIGTAASGLSAEFLFGLVTLLLAIAAQTGVFYKWMGAQFRARDEAIAMARKDASESFNEIRSESLRVERDLIVLKEKINNVPSQIDIESALERRLAPMENKLDRLMLSLAAAGMLRGESSRNRQDDGN